MPTPSTTPGPVAGTGDRRVRRVGILGGTFDPPHVGHLVVAVDVVDALELDEMVLMVAGDPWQKRDRGVSPAADRLAMVQAAVAGVPGLTAGRDEVDRDGPTYTVETLEALRAADPGTELFLVLGTDAVAGLTTWHRWEDLAGLATLVVVDRPGSPAPAAVADLPVVRVPVPQVELSSTELRQRAADGRSLRFLVPDAVCAVVEERGPLWWRPMTDAPAGPPDVTVPPAPAAATDDGAASAPVVRRQGRRRKEQRKVAAAQGVVVALLVGALVALGVVGYRSALRITGGSSNAVTDPALPGYTAEVRPTPVDLVAFTSADGRLAAAALLVGGPGGKGGTVVPVPSTLTLWNYEDSPPAAAFEVFADGGIEALRSRLGSDLTFGLTGASTVPSSALRILAEAAGPVTVELSEPVLDGTTDENQVVKYPAGEVTLDAAGFEEFLTFSGYREPEANRVLRSQQAWEVLLTQLGATSPDQSAGSTSTTSSASSSSAADALAPSLPDLGESAGTGEPPFAEAVAALLTGEVRFDGLPLQRLPLNNELRVVLFRVDQDALPKWVPQVVPFPTSAFPGQRARVRLLRGTADKGVLRSVSPKVVEAGGEVTTVGNAQSFDVATSQVRYQNPDAKDAAAAIGELLGAEVVSTQEDLGGADVEVVVGSDLAE